MNFRDYLIDHAALDWPSLLEEWRWMLPAEFCVWLLTRAGDLFITLPDGSVHMLDVGAGTLQQVAKSREEFLTKINAPGVANNWLMIPIVDRLVASGVGLSPSQCYSFQQLPVLGGKYTAENRTPLPIREHFGGWGSIHHQLKGLPDGSRVVLKVVE